MIKINIKDEPNCKWIHVEGRIDGVTAPELQSQINTLIEVGNTKLLMELEQVDYLSSAGLRVFMNGQKLLKRAGGELILYKASQPVFEIFQLSGFANIFTILTTDEELRAYLK
ncbi:MAG: anti-sigma factor antagonist [Candidatus Omnitrophota bacterium]|jgi:anti-anti-sigma factor|nr:MAG: anti-sigma factor antagonist [Candidatus Omnitrophota bacterium]